ncbi:hypothetical protein WNZ15_10725 [Roseibium sp. AS2]|uniref:hypothetical protein n=1 Tax=Roseibium sp. AS2 TaxID=3135781 RepID=UPI00317CBB00
MIEAAMYVALGFCTAGLIGLAILPAFYRRAARLTEEALRAVNPASYAEVRASQDQERARYAVELRRVEIRLDKEREKAAKFHQETTRTLTEIEALRKSHQESIAELEGKLAEQDSDRHAVDMLSAEVKTLKQKLSDTEKALSESWARTSEGPAADEEATGASQEDPNQEDASGWLPATATMELAAITGLEAEVATLKAKLAKYEPTVAGEIESALNEAAKTRHAELEAQLVDTEAQYVSAQAEVTRLSLMLEASNVADTGSDERLQKQLEKMTGEIAAQRAELQDRERKLRRLTGQMQTLRSDLASAPELTELRKDFRALARQLAQDGSIAIKPAAASPARRTSRDDANAAPEAGPPPPASATGTRANGSGSRSGTARAPGETGNSAGGPAASSARTADIASAAEALVSRIVASSRAKSGDEPDGTVTPPASRQKSAPKRGTGTAPKSKTAKPKKKDVA